MKYLTVMLLLLNVPQANSCLAQDRVQPHSESATKTISNTSYYDVEVVRDLYALHLQDIQPAAGQVWIVAHVTPIADAEQSQDTLILGPLDEPEHGDFHILLTLAGSADKVQENYSWLIHFPIKDITAYHKRKDAFDNPAFSHFTQGGFVICRINKSIPGNSVDGYQRYDPAYLIPSGFQGYVLPALTYYKAHPGLLDEQKSTASADPQKEKAFLNLMHNSNPLLAAAAFRIFVAAHPMNTSEVKPYLEHLQGLPLALNCYILLNSAQFQGKSDAGSKLLLSVITSATTIDQISNIFTSVHALEEDAEPYPVSQAVTEIRAYLMERQAILSSKNSNKLIK